MTFTHFQVSCVYASYKYSTTFLHLYDCKQDIDPVLLAFLLVKYMDVMLQVFILKNLVPWLVTFLLS